MAEHVHKQIHFLRLSRLNLPVPPGRQTSVAKVHKVPAVVISDKAKAALTFTAAALICLQPASHACSANAQSGIQTRRWNDRWVMQRDDRAQTAAALFLCEDRVCHPPICTRQIHQSHYNTKLNICSPQFRWICEIMAYMMPVTAQLYACLSMILVCEYV